MKKPQKKKYKKKIKLEERGRGGREEGGGRGAFKIAFRLFWFSRGSVISFKFEFLEKENLIFDYFFKLKKKIHTPYLPKVLLPHNLFLQKIKSFFSKQENLEKEKRNSKKLLLISEQKSEKEILPSPKAPLGYP